jgi:hypothetical protein
MFGLSRKVVIQKRINPYPPADIPTVFIGGKQPAVHIGLTHKTAVFFVDYVFIHKRQEVIKKPFAILLPYKVEIDI